MTTTKKTKKIPKEVELIRESITWLEAEMEKLSPMGDNGWAVMADVKTHLRDALHAMGTDSFWDD